MLCFKDDEDDGIDSDHVVGVYGWTPLHEAAKDGEAERVKVWASSLLKYSRRTVSPQSLLDQGKDINVKDSANNSTPLHQAAQYGQVDVVKVRQRSLICRVTNDWLSIQVLLDRSADIEAKDYMKQTPLHLAAQHGRIRKGPSTQSSLFCEERPSA